MGKQGGRHARAIRSSVARWPLLVIGTYRDLELDVTRPFAKVLETLVAVFLAWQFTVSRRMARQHASARAERLAA